VAGRPEPDGRAAGLSTPTRSHTSSAPDKRKDVWPYELRVLGQGRRDAVGDRHDAVPCSIHFLLCTAARAAADQAAREHPGPSRDL
jgi:hypothetical protein